MNTFIFQSVEDRFDLRMELQVNIPETWYATRYRSEMHPDDVVHFWMGGPPTIRGLYGWGFLKSEAFIKEKWDSHGVDVVCMQRYREPILATALQDTALGDMLIFRAPQATNFLLSSDEAAALAKFILKRGEQPPPTGGVVA